jgi:hypothetical protein
LAAAIAEAVLMPRASEGRHARKAAREEKQCDRARAAEGETRAGLIVEENGAGRWRRQKDSVSLLGFSAARVCLNTQKKEEEEEEEEEEALFHIFCISGLKQIFLLFWET